MKRNLWYEVNHLLVGFGQEICRPVGPKCEFCKCKNICPAAAVEIKQKPKVNKKKSIKIEYENENENLH